MKWSDDYYTTSRTKIEIDITYRCNLKCLNCDRSCRQAPSEDDMSVAQIRAFIRESEIESIKWERIRIMGGEPFLHPNIKAILEVLAKYKETHWGTEIEVVTNGTIPIEVPSSIGVKNTMKIGQFHKKFEAFNVAPCDVFVGDEMIDYSKGCWITQYCGMGLNKYGYYPCGVGAGIDRVFGFDIGLKKIPTDESIMVLSKKKLCPLCGHYFNRKYIKPEDRVPIVGEPQTISWKNAYMQYQKHKPVLTKYIGDK